MEQVTLPLHHRRSIRLPGHDYTSEGGYFITCVTQERKHLFGEIIDGKMHLNAFGKIVKEEWFETAKMRLNIELDEDEFVVMPNHIHGIIWIMDDCRGTLQRAPIEQPTTVERFQKPVSNSIPTIIRLYKSTTTKQINLLRQLQGERVWQCNYFEHIIRSEKDYEAIANYIYDNPQNWEKDDENPF